MTRHPPIPQAPPRSGSRPPPEPTTALGRLRARHPWSLPLLFAGGAVILFFVIRKLSDLLPSPQLAKVIYLAFFLGVFTFAYKCYADHVVGSYFTIKSRILALYEKANTREMPDLGEKPLQVPANEPGERSQPVPGNDQSPR